MIRRFFCMMVGHEWIVVWCADGRCRSKTMVTCHRCGEPGWEM